MGNNSLSSKTKALLSGNILALTTAICWGLNEPANKIIIPSDISAQAVALCRIFGAAVMVWLISLFTKKETINRSDWKLLWLSSLMMLGFIYVFSLAFNTASPIDIAIILTFQPMLVVAIHALFMGEHVGRLEALGMLIAFTGAILVILGGGSVDSGRFTGDLLAMVCAVTYSVYLVLIEGPSKRYGTVTLMKWVFLLAAILSLPLVFTIPSDGKALSEISLRPMLVLGFIILFPTVYCYLVTPLAIRRIGSEILAFYQYLVPVVATVVSLCMHLDSFHWYQPVSFAVIVGGVLLANYAKAKKVSASGSCRERIQ